MKRVKQCVKCSAKYSLSFFNFKNKGKNKRNVRCKYCTRQQVMTSYYKNRQHYLSYRRKRNKLLYTTVRIFVYQYLQNHPCVDCGISDPRVLQFDHVRVEKRMEVSAMARDYYSIKQVAVEMSKCEVRCANCHSIKTAVERNYYLFAK